MRFETVEDGGLLVTGLTELAASNAGRVRDGIRAALPPGCRRLDLDLSQTRFVDSSGLGTLIALHKTLRSNGGELRVLYPTPGVIQILELTRLHGLFEIVLGTSPHPAE